MPASGRRAARQRLIAAGSALMIWSGFWMRLFDVEVNGLVWALLGALSAVVVVRKEDAL